MSEVKEAYPLKQLVCFAILMENGGGIRDKSPDYILEKYRRCMNHEAPETMLDMNNQLKLMEYNQTWKEKEQWITDL